ncbi:MAG: hypothetical protein Q9216_005862, partial [Gyalolechia sp. 2 TL-2023]
IRPAPPPSAASIHVLKIMVGFSGRKSRPALSSDPVARWSIPTCLDEKQQRYQQASRERKIVKVGGSASGGPINGD